MSTSVFIVLAIVLIIVVVYHTLKRKITCPFCKSNNVELTGNKKHIEDPPAAVFGSPDSYQELEYKCQKCGQLFWEKRRAAIIN